jgi:hypothetical protein
VLLNTIAIFVQNEFLGSIIAKDELGNGGVAIGFEKSELERARLTLPEAAIKYQEAQEIFWLQLQNIVNNSKEHFENHSVQLEHIKVPTGHYSLFIHRLRLIKGIIEQKGIRVALRTVANYLLYTVGRFWKKGDATQKPEKNY